MLVWCHVSRARKQDQFRAPLPVVYWVFVSYFFGPSLKHMFERSLKLLLCILKWFNASQVLKWCWFHLRAACIICACAINTDIWQATIACATSLQKTVVSHLKFKFFNKHPWPSHMGVLLPGVSKCLTESDPAKEWRNEREKQWWSEIVPPL